MPAHCAALHASRQLQDLLAAVPACQKDAQFLAQLGQQLNRESRFADAADHLERALMLEPDLKDAQLSYAIALTGMGDLPAAQALLDQLLQDPTMPSPLRTSLTRQRDALEQAQLAKTQDNAIAEALAAAAAGWQSRITLGARLGYDSNLLGAPNLESLTLTFAGQTLELPLDESYLARGGAYARAEAQLDLRRTEPSGAQWNLLAALRSRTSPVVASAGSTQFDFLADRSYAPGLLGYYVSVNATQLQPQVGSRFNAVGFNAGWAGVWQTATAQDCQARAGLDVQDRSYADVSVLSGRYSGFSSSISCDVANGPQWVLGFRTGQDRALDAARPGGDQQQTSLRASAFLPLPFLAALWSSAMRLPHGALLLSQEYATQQDSSGYSEYIDSGRTRNVTRQATRVELQYPVSAHSQWVLGLDWLTQSSTLALFQQRSWGANLGYRLGW